MDVENGSAIVQYAIEHGVLINIVGNKTLRFVPPLTTSKDEIDQVIGILAQAEEVG